MKYHIDEHKDYMRHVMQIWQYVYRMAHAATGSRELAEVVLQESMLDVYARFGDSSLKDNFRRSISDCAQERRRKLKRGDVVDVDWAGFSEQPDGLSSGDARLWQAISALPVEVRRIIVLRTALRWTDKQVADALGMRRSEVKKLYDSAIAQLSRRYVPAQKAGGAQ